MIKIKIFCSFAPSNLCKEKFENSCNAKQINFYGKYKKYYFVEENEDYTHAIIINTSMPELKIPKENVIGLAFEPIYFLGLSDEFIKYAQKYIGKYFIGDKFDLPEPFIENLGYLWFYRPAKEIIMKSKLISIVVSEKKYAPGHIYRHNLVQTIIDMNLPIDIYGRGTKQYSAKTKNIKGEFENTEPYKNYLFTISIENFTSNHYFSEKLMTPLMYNCMPIYFGCKNINQYIENIINLTGNLKLDLNLIYDIINYPQKYYRKTFTDKNTKTINLIENLHTIFT
jgi:hypothetical protein